MRTHVESSTQKRLYKVLKELEEEENSLSSI